MTKSSSTKPETIEVERDSDGNVLMCTGCGTVETIASVRGTHPTAFTCCPERKMVRAVPASTKPYSDQGEGIWRTDEPPKDGTIIYRRVISVYRFQPYKPNSQQFKHGLKGRWQEMNEYGGWDNCNQPLGNEWTDQDPFATPSTPETGA